MEKIDAALRGTAVRTAAVAAATLATALLPWIVAFAPPLLRSLQVGFAAEVWRFAVGRLTTPVLFLLLNFVIISIWATSAAAAANSSASASAADALAADSIIKRKETVIVLPPVSPVKKSYNLQASVFSRSPPQILLADENADENAPENAHESEDPPTPTPAAAAAAAAADLDEEPARESFVANKKMELKISPPPPPSFLLEQRRQQKQQQQKQQQQKQQQQQQFLRRNSEPAVRGPSKARTRRSLSDRNRSTISFGGPAVGEAGARDATESTDELRMKFESVIANFHAQLRLQTRDEEEP